MKYEFFKKIINSYNDIQKISFNKDCFTLVDLNGIEIMIFDYEKQDAQRTIPINALLEQDLEDKSDE